MTKYLCSLDERVLQGSLPQYDDSCLLLQENIDKLNIISLVEFVVFSLDISIYQT